MDLEGDPYVIRRYETNFGDLVADAAMERVVGVEAPPVAASGQQPRKMLEQAGVADLPMVALINAGAVRQSLLAVSMCTVAGGRRPEAGGQGWWPGLWWEWSKRPESWGACTWPAGRRPLACAFRTASHAVLCCSPCKQWAEQKKGGMPLPSRAVLATAFLHAPLRNCPPHRAT